MVGFTITAWQKLEKRFQNEIMIGFVQITRFQLRTISWHHEMYVNTCTSDNFLTILLLHCHEHKELLNNIGLNDVELAFKSGIKLMLQNNIHKGKTVVLDYFKTKLNLEKNGTKYNCFGSEYEMCLKLFRHVWKLYVTLNCNSVYCPKLYSERYPVSFNFQPLSTKSFLTQIKPQFPSPGEGAGYCGVEFSHIPANSEVPYALSTKEDITSKQTIEYYEYRGVPIVQNANFLCASLWIIPFCISNFKSDQVRILAESLPILIEIYGRKYKLAGLTLYKSAHFTAVVSWHGSKYFYDGLKSSDAMCLRPVKIEDFNGQEGSYAIYLLI